MLLKLKMYPRWIALISVRALKFYKKGTFFSSKNDLELYLTRLRVRLDIIKRV